MGYTGFHTIYYHGFLKVQLAGIGERLAAMEQKFLYAITYEKTTDPPKSKGFLKRFAEMVFFLKARNVIRGFAFGRDFNGQIRVVLDTENFDEVFNSLKIKGLDYTPEIVQTTYAVFDEVILDFLLNTRDIGALGSLVSILNNAVYLNNLPCEVTQIA